MGEATVASGPGAMAHVPAMIRAALVRFREELEAELGDRLETVMLYGSWARGEPRVGSDVDVLVLVRDRTLDDAARVSSAETRVLLDTAVALSVQLLSVEEFRLLLERETAFAQNVQREGIAV